MKKRIEEGFTLVEILIVVVIVGILAAIAIPTYFSYVERAYASDAQTQIKTLLENHTNIEIFALGAGGLTKSCPTDHWYRKGTAWRISTGGKVEGGCNCDFSVTINGEIYYVVVP